MSRRRGLTESEQTGPGGGCLEMRASRTVEVEPGAEGWSSERTLPFPPFDKRRRADLTLPFVMW